MSKGPIVKGLYLLGNIGHLVKEDNSELKPENILYTQNKIIKWRIPFSGSMIRERGGGDIAKMDHK